MLSDRLKHIFEFTKRESERFIRKGREESDVRAWAARNAYYMARKSRDPEWEKVQSMRGSFTRMLFKKPWGVDPAVAATMKRRITKTCDGICGCGWQFLRDHIEGQFKAGMTWENHGKGRQNWCVDHVKAICLFDWWTDEGRKQAFHWTNVQPLWYHEHRAKSDEDMRLARTRRLEDEAYSARLLKPEYPPPMEGTNEEIMAKLEAQLQSKP